MPDPSLADIQGLATEELADLVRELLEAEGAHLLPHGQGGVAADEAEPFLLQEEDRLRLIEAHRSEDTPLGGISLPGVAARATAAGASAVTVFLSGVVDAERQAGLSQVLARVQGGMGVSIDLVDGHELLTRLVAQPQLAARYFPSEDEAERAGADQGIPRTLVRIAYAVAPKPRATPSPTVGLERLRLLWTAGAVLLLMWVPLRLNPWEARLVGGAVLGVILLALLVAQLAPGIDAQPPRRSVMDALIPVKDELVVGRSVTRGRLGNGPAGISIDILNQLPRVLVRASTKTALLLFLVGCSSSYLLLWGIDPGACASTANCDHAFAGPADRAHLGDFMNLAVHAAFFNLPDNIEPASRFARALVGAQFVLSAVLLGSYAAFFGFGLRRERGSEQEKC